MKNTVIIAVFLTLVSCQKNENERIEQIKNSQPDILTERQIDSVLHLFEEVNYTDLNQDYKAYSHPENKFNSELKNRKFYKIFGNQMDLKIIGDFTVRDFIPHDEYYKAYKKNPFPEFEQYWLVDHEVLFMMLELILQLEAEGYNKYGFHIRTAHRHPQKNADVNGASYSQHMFGKAIDIGVDDINNDGESTQEDKMIVYNMLQEIVGSDGGLGLYPGSMNLHFDCRGHKARWDFP